MTIPQTNATNNLLSDPSRFYPRHDWSTDEVAHLFSLPICDLILEAQSALRRHFKPNTVQLSTLMNIKSGGCPEDCSYCPQSAHYEVGRTKGSLAELDEVIAAAVQAKSQGATRFCMGAAWRSPTEKDLVRVQAMVSAVKSLEMETCVTLGMLNQAQAHALKTAGLDYYNHNLDTSEAFYPSIISTRTYEDRLETLENVRKANIYVCSGGILGLGESRQDRIAMLLTLANLPQHPESVPINTLVRVAGTPLADAAPVEPFEIVRVIAVARILMPASYVRLSAGRTDMTDELQAFCFLAGANSIFYGDRLLTTDNPEAERDRQLFGRLGIAVAT